MVELRANYTVTARRLEFAILTGGRSGEARGACWGEFDADATHWTVAAERMKAGREHPVPLSAPALAILETMAKLRRGNDAGELIFPSMKPGKPLSSRSRTTSKQVASKLMPATDAAATSAFASADRTAMPTAAQMFSESCSA